jgi:hypothetical protein
MDMPTMAGHGRAFAMGCIALLLATTLTAAQAGGNLTFCSEAAPEAFDVAQSQTNPTYDAVGLTLYESLTRIRTADAQVVPGWQSPGRSAPMAASTPSSSGLG